MYITYSFTGGYMFKCKVLAALMTLASSVCFSAFAIIGIGVHYSADLTMHMDDNSQQLVFSQLKINSGVSGYTLPLDGTSLPIYVDRTSWERKPFNLGAKIFIDIVPFLDCIELSSNFGAWQYDGVIKYPRSMTYTGTNSGIPKPTDFSVVYDSIPITLEKFDLGYLGIDKTPYMKLNFDLTIRKFIVRFPKPLKTLNVYAGGGATLLFATPVLSAKIVEDALGNTLNASKSVIDLGADILGKDEVMKAVAEEIGNQLMTPHWGCHIDAGVMVKLPVLPVGIYVDGKFMIPFGDIDESADVGGMGLLLNAGINLIF
jgi:hypothetical protein